MDEELHESLLSTEEAAKYLGVSTRMLAVRRLKGNSPEYFALSRCCVKYSKKQLDDWLAKHVVSSTTEASELKCGEKHPPTSDVE